MTSRSEVRVLTVSFPEELAGKIERHAQSEGQTVGELLADAYDVMMREQLEAAFDQNCSYLRANHIPEASLEEAVAIVRAYRTQASEEQAVTTSQ